MRQMVMTGSLLFRPQPVAIRACLVSTGTPPRQRGLVWEDQRML
jgi:hypothetical protein